jgi:hypothetical protein
MARPTRRHRAAAEQHRKNRRSPSNSRRAFKSQRHSDSPTLIPGFSRFLFARSCSCLVRVRNKSNETPGASAPIFATRDWPEPIRLARSVCVICGYPPRLPHRDAESLGGFLPRVFLCDKSSVPHLTQGGSIGWARRGPIGLSKERQMSFHDRKIRSYCYFALHWGHVWRRRKSAAAWSYGTSAA